MTHPGSHGAPLIGPSLRIVGSLFFLISSTLSGSLCWDHPALPMGMRTRCQSQPGLKGESPNIFHLQIPNMSSSCLSQDLTRSLLSHFGLTHPFPSARNSGVILDPALPHLPYFLADLQNTSEMLLLLLKHSFLHLFLMVVL